MAKIAGLRHQAQSGLLRETGLLDYKADRCQDLPRTSWSQLSLILDTGHSWLRKTLLQVGAEGSKVWENFFVEECKLFFVCLSLFVWDGFYYVSTMYSGSPPASDSWGLVAQVCPTMPGNFFSCLCPTWMPYAHCTEEGHMFYSAGTLPQTKPTNCLTGDPSPPLSY